MFQFRSAIAHLDQLYAHLTLKRLRAANASVDPALRVRGGIPHIHNDGQMSFGEAVRLRNEPARIRLRTAPGGHIRLGSAVSLNSGVSMFSAISIEIGEGSRIGDNVALFDTSFHAVHEGDTPRPRPIRIGRNVWIGRNAIIMPGVSIGDHSVISAGSVVFENIGEKQVWRGNPAGFVKDVRASDCFERI